MISCQYGCRDKDLFVCFVTERHYAARFSTFRTSVKLFQTSREQHIWIFCGSWWGHEGWPPSRCIVFWFLIQEYWRSHLKLRFWMQQPVELNYYWIKGCEYFPCHRITSFKFVMCKWNDLTSLCLTKIPLYIICALLWFCSRKAQHSTSILKEIKSFLSDLGEKKKEADSNISLTAFVISTGHKRHKSSMHPLVEFCAVCHSLELNKQIGLWRTCCYRHKGKAMSTLLFFSLRRAECGFSEPF